MPVADLLDAYTAGSEQVRELLLRSGDAAAEQLTRRLFGLERPALTRLAAGYAEGLEDTIDRLRRLADESSPLDADSGAMKPVEFGERLSLEVERCQRMDLPLGLVELAVEAAEVERHAAGHAGAAPCTRWASACARACAATTAWGSRRTARSCWSCRTSAAAGLAGAAERIRRQVDSCAGHGDAPEVTFALAHYDFVDASATEMLTALGRSLRAGQRERPAAGVGVSLRLSPEERPDVPECVGRGDERQSVTGRPSASAARRTISRSFG